MAMHTKNEEINNGIIYKACCRCHKTFLLLTFITPKNEDEKLIKNESKVVIPSFPPNQDQGRFFTRSSPSWQIPKYILSRKKKDSFL